MKEGEGARAALMFGYIFLVIASLLIVKPVRNSLFLTRFGPEQLPYAFIIVALVSTIVAFSYSHLAGRFSLDRLMSSSLLFFAGCLTVVWVLLISGYQAGWFIYAFYVWVAVFGIITASQFWLLANYVFNAREAKRMFGFLGTGGIAGGIFGGYLTNAMTRVVGTAHLVFACIIFLLVCFVLLQLVWKKYALANYRDSQSKRYPQEEKSGFTRPIKTVLGSRHLTYLAAIVGVGVVVANLVDYQFNAIAAAEISNKDQLTAFFGFWFSNLSVFSLAVQLFFTSRIIKKFGVVNSLNFLPGGIMAGAAAVLFAPFLWTTVLWSAVMVKVSEGGLKQSINKAGLELLALPIPSKIKNEVKSFIDIFVDNVATGIGGVLLLILTAGFQVGAQWISILIGGLVVVWMFCIRFVKGEYVNSFRVAIEKRTLDLADPSVNLDDPSIAHLFEKVFEGDNERQILYLLRFLEDTPATKFVTYMERLIHHPSLEIKASVLRMAIVNRDIDLIEVAQELTQHEDSQVRIPAIRYLCRQSEQPMEVLHDFLRNNDVHVYTTAMVCAAEEYRDRQEIRESMDFVKLYEDTFAPESFGEMSAADAITVKTRAAEVIGIVQIPELYPYLHKLFKDTSDRVLQASVSSAGNTGSQDFVSLILEQLKTGSVRRTAREALAQYGETIIEDLVAVLVDVDATADLRFGVAKVLAMIKSQQSVDALLEHYEQDDLGLRFQIIKALNALRNRAPSLKFDKKRVIELVNLEVRNYYLLSSIRQQHHAAKNTYVQKDSGDALPAWSLLDRAIMERLDVTLERVFRLLGSRYSQGDIYNAYRGVLSGNPVYQANAVEYLDNILDEGLKLIIIPIVERKSMGDYLAEVPEMVPVDVSEGDGYLTMLLKGTDVWLKACALFLMAQARDKQWMDVVSGLIEHPEDIVKETAEYAVREIQNVA